MTAKPVAALPEAPCLTELLIVNFEFEGLTPLEGMDRIYADYSKTFGRSPDAFMAQVVGQTKEDLFMWWGCHRETIRAALLADQAPAGKGSQP